VKRNGNSAKKYPFPVVMRALRTFTASAGRCNNSVMQHLRNAKQLARFVLVWFALSIGVAIASPMVSPQGMQLICSGAGAMKLIVAGDDGKVPAASHSLECPLCASISAPPPMEIVAFSGAVPQPLRLPAPVAERVFAVLAAPPPARGPPALS
jgi:hypothetical protein